MTKINFYLTKTTIIILNIFRNVTKVSNDSGLMQQAQSTHTLPHHHHHYQKQPHSGHATLPRSSVIHDMGLPRGVDSLNVR